MKHYGIYIGYPPTVDLRHEGLGRYLAAFIKGAAAQEDVRFTLLCPSWSSDSLTDLLESEGVPANSCHVVSPQGVPLVLRMYQKLLKHRRRGTGKRFIKRSVQWLQLRTRALAQSMVDRLVQTHSLASLLLAFLPLVSLLVAALLLSPIWVTLALLLMASMLGKRLLRKALTAFRSSLLRIRRILSVPKENGFVRRLYRAMEESEALRMQALINTIGDVRAWYCPTAFWPAFNLIQAPRLMCVPDVVLSDFPVGFSTIGGDRFLENFETVERAISGGQHFVTYSADVKWSTLVDRYGIQGNQISVVHHAPNDLSQWVMAPHLKCHESLTRNYCRSLISSALSRSQYNSYITGFTNSEFKFLFYASQMRPNKNVLTLLRAYAYLLRERLIGHKLILTGKPNVLPEIEDFVTENNLQNEVLFLHGLKTQELAACYYLADLAVNPSLSEGGCPFTFTEALSVGTPVVMARIPVSLEVLTERALQATTFFDPYDWRDMAERIEWGLSHRDELLAIQRPTYQRLAQRTWQNVVQEHIVILDRIAEQ